MRKRNDCVSCLWCVFNQVGTCNLYNALLWSSIQNQMSFLFFLNSLNPFIICAATISASSGMNAISIISFLYHFFFTPFTVKRWIKGGVKNVSSLTFFFFFFISQKRFFSFLLSLEIMLHTSHFNTGLRAQSERRNLVLVMKTYIPARLPERGPH